MARRLLARMFVSGEILEVEQVTARMRRVRVGGEALAGSDRPFVVTSGLAGFALGRTMTEDDSADPNSPRGSEQAALAFTTRGVRVSVLRLPPSVHG